MCRATKTDLYLHITAKPILEECRDIRYRVFVLHLLNCTALHCRVAPYSWDYPGRLEDLATAGLDPATNWWVLLPSAVLSTCCRWDQVGDFDWLATDRPSPHWSVLPEGERRTVWDTCDTN